MKWRFEQRGETFTLWQDEPRERILSITNGVLPMNQHQRMIAALPEAFEALEAMLYCGTGGPQAVEARRKAESVMAKIRGELPATMPWGNRGTGQT